ncbi:dihydroneopterin aldolase [Paraglaciecola chathamensis]|jgi:dihydroneopterin aldolase|uniref:7,8-dihydroneopterin aldolase n=1 Tax=Paraglaciecola chathamensis TaxID=368405 RepID=A0A8H9ICD6_9ALTE|nr:dihydroneopterin aldolase [Paraglaciecola oceanifecundans]AEE24298.1 dihydroneopterin aldolase [Glaciecola sp. 4H-3-7+YE-5]GGZ66645.1 7,8-dihydroneopterin aldolase [Paraglaciecola oceanifecundans]
MDKIYIEGLEVQSLIGVYDWERDATQRLLVDIVLFSDLQKPAYSDDVEDTLNYAEVAEAITQVAKQSEFALIEALGQAMITQIFTQFPVQKITLKLSKPDILADAQNVAVEFTRERKDT